jgi:hypothetical protein
MQKRRQRQLYESRPAVPLTRYYFLPTFHSDDCPSLSLLSVNPFQQKIHRSAIDAFDTAEILRESALEKVGKVG